MSDLIRREDVVKAMNEALAVGDISRTIANDILNDIPSAEPERHRGEWIEDGHGYSECSKCGYIAESVLSRMLYKFCPNCGAEMSRGE